MILVIINNVLRFILILYILANQKLKEKDLYINIYQELKYENNILLYLLYKALYKT